MKFIRNNNYLLLVVVLCMVFTVVGFNKIEVDHDVVYATVTVAEGDTLWGYSVEYGNNVPSDKWIKEIKSINNLSTSTIQVGRELQIPIKSGLNQNDIATHIVGDDK